MVFTRYYLKYLNNFGIFIYDKPLAFIYFWIKHENGLHYDSLPFKINLVFIHSGNIPGPTAPPPYFSSCDLKQVYFHRETRFLIPIQRIFSRLVGRARTPYPAIIQ